MGKAAIPKPKSWHLARHVRRLLKAPGERFSDIEYAVLEQLCWHHNELKGYACPGVKVIAWYVDRDERTVQRVLRALLAVGVITCAYRKGGRSERIGYASHYVLHILDWPHTKPALERPADADLGRHSSVTLDTQARVTSERHPKSPVRVTFDEARVTFDGSKGDISGTLGRHLGVTQTDMENREGKNREREPGVRGRPAHVAAGAAVRSLSLVKTTDSDRDPDPGEGEDDDDDEPELTAEDIASIDRGVRYYGILDVIMEAMGVPVDYETGTGRRHAAGKQWGDQADALLDQGATGAEVRAGFVIMRAEYADAAKHGKPLNASPRALANNWAHFGELARAQVARDEAAARTREANAQAEQAAAAYRAQQQAAADAEAQRRAALTPAERDAEDASRRERAHASTAAERVDWQGLKAKMHERINRAAADAAQREAAWHAGESE